MLLLYYLVTTDLTLIVKPYIPYDVVPSEYVLPMATAADGTALPARLLQVPEWVVEADIPMLPVHIPQQVQQDIAQCVERKNRSKTASCTNALQAIELITQVHYNNTTLTIYLEMYLHYGDTNLTDILPYIGVASGYSRDSSRSWESTAQY